MLTNLCQSCLFYRCKVCLVCKTTYFVGVLRNALVVQTIVLETINPTCADEPKLYE